MPCNSYCHLFVLILGIFSVRNTEPIETLLDIVLCLVWDLILYIYIIYIYIYVFSSQLRSLGRNSGSTGGSESSRKEVFSVESFKITTTSRTLRKSLEWRAMKHLFLPEVRQIRQKVERYKSNDFGRSYFRPHNLCALWTVPLSRKKSLYVSLIPAWK